MAGGENVRGGAVAVDGGVGVGLRVLDALLLAVRGQLDLDRAFDGLVPVRARKALGAFILYGLVWELSFFG